MARVINLACGIVIDDQNRLLLLKRSADSHFPNTWQLPEGKIENAEDPSETIKREITEELRTQTSRVVFKKIIPHLVEVDNQFILAVRLPYDVQIGKKIKLSSEHQEYGWFSTKDALSLNLAPGIKEVIESL